MSKLLVVKGHPLTAELSMSLKGLDAFVEAYKAAHPTDEIEVLDVYKENIPALDAELVGGMYAGEKATAEQQALLNAYSSYTEQFVTADKVVIANPLYNLMIPAELKAWIDTLNVAGKTFKYTAEGPVGLLGGKKVLQLQANGGFYEGKDPATFYMSSVFGFMGADFKQIAIEGHAYAPDQAEALLAAFIEKVEAEAASF